MGSKESERQTERSYHSLFEKADWKFISEHRFDYGESFSDVLFYLDWAFQQDSTNQLAIAHKVLAPPRLIRGVLDYKIEKANKQFLYDAMVQPFVSYTTEVALALYKDPSKEQALKLLDDYRQTIPKFSLNHGLFEDSVSQVDNLSWKYNNPAYSENTARQLTNELQKSPMLLLPLAHGSVPAGFDMFLRYRDISKNEESLVYPVRFSKQKREDAEPQLTTAEKEYLHEMGKERHVVIFDEDSTSYAGNTISRAYHFFKDLFPEEQSIRIKINERSR